MVAWRRRGAFCKGIVSTARRGGLPFAPAKGSKTGQRGTKLSPLQTPLTLSCGWIRTMQGIVRTAPQIRSQGACGAFYFGFCRDRIKCACGSLSASSNPAPGIRSVSGRGGSDASGSWGAAPSVFWFLLYAQKEHPGGEPYRPSPPGDSATPIGDYKLGPAGQAR